MNTCKPFPCCFLFLIHNSGFLPTTLLIFWFPSTALPSAVLSICRT